MSGMILTLQRCIHGIARKKHSNLRACSYGESFAGIFLFHQEDCSAEIIVLDLSCEKRTIALCLWCQRIDHKQRRFPCLAGKCVHMGKYSSAKWDPGRVQARSQLAGKRFSHVNICSNLIGKSILGGISAEQFPGETRKCGRNFLHAPCERALNLSCCIKPLLRSLHLLKFEELKYRGSLSMLLS